MKKFGILTIHNALNYGAALQAYATQRLFERLGIKAEIIDYRIKAEAKKQAMFLPPVSQANIKQDIRNARHPIMFMRRKRSFAEFMEKNMKCSQTVYERNNIEKVAEQGYDCLITGSDQTFNLNLGGNPTDREAYFLPFEFNGKKAAYSASMGDAMSNFSDKQKAFMKKCLTDYDAISVRETKAADFIENLTGRRPKVTYDPTLALTKEEWDRVSSGNSIADGKYILFYTVSSEPWVVDFVKRFSAKTGIKIVAAHPQNIFEINCNFERASDGGPGEFISLIKNAELVLTTSFHGTVFSMIYKKPFYSFLCGAGTRIKSMLNKANLMDRTVDVSMISEKNFSFENIDVTRTEKFLNKAQESNIDFIKTIL